MIQQTLTQEEKSLLESGFYRQLPIAQCMMNCDWELTRKVNIVLMRKLANDAVCVSFYIVDLLCVGIKHVGFIAEIDAMDVPGKITAIFKRNALSILDCEYSQVHQIIEKALNYADGLGIAPESNFNYVKYMLDANNDGKNDQLNVQLGKNGRPYLCIDDDDNRLEYYIEQLNKHVGEGNYTFKDHVHMSESEDVSAILDKWDMGQWNDFIDEFDVDDYADAYPIMNYAFNKIFDGYEGSAGLLEKMAQFSSTCEVNYDMPEIRLYQKRPGELEALESLVKYMSDAGIAEARKLLAQTKTYIVQWPDNIEFRNFKFQLETILGIEVPKDEFKKLTEDFPDNLLAKISYALSLTIEGRFDKSRAYCNYSDTLAELCPDRTVFHAREFIAFTHLMAMGYSSENKIFHAYAYISMFAKVDPEIREEGYSDSLFAFINGAATMLFLDVIDNAKRDAGAKNSMIKLIMDMV